MSPRRRNAKNRGLPAYLYPVGTSGRHWRYAHPSLPKPKNFTASRADAIEAAKAANARLASEAPLVDQLLGAERDRLALSIQRFRKEHLAKQEMSESHRKDWEWRLNKIERELGAKSVEAIDVRVIADWLDPMPVRTSNMHRARLIQLFDWMIAKGLIDHNPASATLLRQEKRRRQRLTHEQYEAIWQHANAPMRNAMDLSLYCLQRRADVARMRFADVREGHIHVEQSKTGKRLRLPLLPEIVAVVNRCKDGVFAAHLVHQPEGNRRRQGKPLSPESLSRGFARARDACGLFDQTPEPERPTFHEIVSLGEHLRRDQGWSVEAIQAWRGHSEASMTEHYLEGHEHWETVKPGS